MAEKKQQETMNRDQSPAHSTPATPATPIDSEVQTSQASEANKEINDLKDTLRFVQAEFENFRKRVERDNQEIVKYATADTIKPFLTVIDHFEIALKSANREDEFVKGIEMIYHQFINVLESMHIKIIRPENQQYNPQEHEALLQSESDKPAGTILEVLQPGYRMHDRVLRTAKVKIAKQ